MFLEWFQIVFFFFFLFGFFFSITPEKKNSSNLYLVHFLSEESIKLVKKIKKN